MAVRSAAASPCGPSWRSAPLWGTNDHVRGAAADHDRRRVRGAGRDGGHDGCVGHAELKRDTSEVPVRSRLTVHNQLQSLSP